MMPQKINYDRLMQETIKNLGSNDKTLLLHSCCAPCSSSVILKLAPFFKLTVFYYNPNIDTSEEYEKSKRPMIRKNSMRFLKVWKTVPKGESAACVVTFCG